MAANVESMFYVRQAPWHGLGVRVEAAPSSEEALRLSGLGLARQSSSPSRPAGGRPHPRLQGQSPGCRPPGAGGSHRPVPCGTERRSLCLYRRAAGGGGEVRNRRLPAKRQEDLAAGQAARPVHHRGGPGSSPTWCSATPTTAAGPSRWP